MTTESSDKGSGGDCFVFLLFFFFLLHEYTPNEWPWDKLQANTRPFQSAVLVETEGD